MHVHANRDILLISKKEKYTKFINFTDFSYVTLPFISRFLCIENLYFVQLRPWCIDDNREPFSLSLHNSISVNQIASTFFLL